MQSKTFDLPILLIVFKRIDTTRKVLDSIQRVKPKKIYIASDAGRENVEGEVAKVESVRSFVLQQINWPCEVKTLFQEKNLGCRYNPENAISWFFEHEEKGIILEDDCVPSNSFYTFSENILNKYEDDMRIFGLVGTHVMERYYKPQTNASYYFREYVQTWGWATWRDRWQVHLNYLEDFDQHLNDIIVRNKLSNKIANQKIIECARISYHDQLDAWDYQWFFTAFANNAVFVVPTNNLIYNIGFGEDATHTFNAEGKSNIAKEIEFPLKHPINIIPDLRMDDLFYKKHYSWYTWWEKVTNFGYVKAAIRARIKRNFK